MTNDADDDDLLRSPTAPETLADLHDPAGDGGRAWAMVPGAEVHFLADGLNLAQGSGTGVFAVPMQRGQVVTLTADLIEKNSDRFGQCWLALADDEDAQVDKWGKRMFAPGRPDSRFRRFLPGTLEADLEHDRRRREVALISGEEARAQALADLDAELGRGRRTSVTLSQLDGGRHV
jgi:hypothetical protein